MAAPLKKRALNDDENTFENNSDSESSGESEQADIQEYVGQEHIQVDFEGRNPIDSDFHGIKQLLQQCFLKAHVNLSELTQVIISQNYVGSVVKQSDDYEMDTDDEEDESTNDVFGITTVLNLTDKQNLECIQQLRSLLVELCSEHGTDQANTLVRSLLSDDSRPVGLLINERLVNIPMQIAVPLLESLSKEVNRAVQKKMPFDFSYYILICKMYKSEEKTKKSKNKKKNANESKLDLIWSNPEEELIDQVADCRFEFSVKGESDSGLCGNWLEDDNTMVPYRRVLLFQASKLESIIDRIKTYVSQ